MSIKLGRNVDEKEIREVCENFLIKRGILEGTLDTVKKKKASAYLWMKIPLLKSRTIERFRFLSNLFNKEVAIPLIIIGIIVIACSIIYLNNKGINFYSIISMNSLDYIYPLIVVYVSTIFHEFGHYVESNIMGSEYRFTAFHAIFFTDSLPIINLLGL